MPARSRARAHQISRRAAPLPPKLSRLSTTTTTMTIRDKKPDTAPRGFIAPRVFFTPRIRRSRVSVMNYKKTKITVNIYTYMYSVRRVDCDNRAVFSIFFPIFPETSKTKFVISILTAALLAVRFETSSEIIKRFFRDFFARISMFLPRISIFHDKSSF